MALFRLVFPDDAEVDLVEQLSVSLGDAAEVELRPDDAHYRLLNTGTVPVTIDGENGPLEVAPSESAELDSACEFYISSNQAATLHRVVRHSLQEALRRPKRQRTEPTLNQTAQFGYQLYRLRGGKNAQLESMEGDLQSWLSGDVEYLCLSDYMIDLDWLISAVPKMTSIPQVLLIHGEMEDGHLKSCIERKGLTESVYLHKPPLPIPFGTHHSKACIVKFPQELRVIVHTANLIYADCGNKTQGAWIQDFPLKATAAPQSPFAKDLLEYLTALQIPRAHKRTLFTLINRHDFSSANVKLIASVPGYHKGDAIHKYGHPAVQRALEGVIFPREFHAAPLVCQFSSLGSLDEKWLYDEFMVSLRAGRVEDDLEQLQPPSKDAQGLQLIWPTVEQVRESIEGWAAGRSIPGPAKNVNKPFLKKHWHRFHAQHLDRADAMPHIKTYTRYANGNLPWVLLASHNLSKAAWGVLQKKGTQLMIRSYELGVLYLPSLGTDSSQSCNPRTSIRGTVPTTVTSAAASFLPYPTPDSTDFASTVLFCLPFQIPPEPYSNEDQPWTVDTPMPGLDRLCSRWGSGGSMYGHLE